MPGEDDDPKFESFLGCVLYFVPLAVIAWGFIGLVIYVAWRLMHHTP